MGFANYIDNYDHSREGSVRARAAWLTFAQILSGGSFALRFAGINYARRPIHLANVFDEELVALEDSIKENSRVTTDQQFTSRDALIIRSFSVTTHRFRTTYRLFEDKISS